MGITSENFFEYLYNVIFNPKAFFEKDDIKKSIRLALGTVILIATLGKIASGIFDGSIKEIFFIFSACTDFKSSCLCI